MCHSCCRRVEICVKYAAYFCAFAFFWKSVAILVTVICQGHPIPDVFRFHVLITTYEVIISDLEHLRKVDWHVAIIDEAHRLKNRNCKLLQGLSCFDVVHSENSWCIVVFIVHESHLIETNKVLTHHGKSLRFWIFFCEI